MSKHTNSDYYKLKFSQVSHLSGANVYFDFFPLLNKTIFHKVFSAVNIITTLGTLYPFCKGCLQVLQKSFSVFVQRKEESVATA